MSPPSIDSQSGQGLARLVHVSVEIKNPQGTACVIGLRQELNENPSCEPSMISKQGIRGRSSGRQ